MDIMLSLTTIIDGQAPHLPAPDGIASAKSSYKSKGHHLLLLRGLHRTIHSMCAEAYQVYEAPKAAPPLPTGRTGSRPHGRFTPTVAGL